MRCTTYRCSIDIPCPTTRGRELETFVLEVVDPRRTCRSTSHHVLCGVDILVILVSILLIYVSSIKHALFDMAPPVL